jgi:hypothetical protein
MRRLSLQRLLLGLDEHEAESLPILGIYPVPGYEARQVPVDSRSLFP